MELQSSIAYKILKDKGVTEIYHANSVATSCAFLRNDRLMSRGNVERRGLYQTPQNSDDTDKESAVWFDLFTDSVDIHKRGRKANVYGPVLFVLDAKIIKHDDNTRIWITKRNPIYWSGTTHDERWFSSTKELKATFSLGTFQQMIVFRHCGGELPFHQYLKRVVLDDPKKKTLTGMSYYSMAYGALKAAMSDGYVDANIFKRRCGTGCKCLKEYEADSKGTRTMFFPYELDR